MSLDKRVCVEQCHSSDCYCCKKQLDIGKFISFWERKPNKQLGMTKASRPYLTRESCNSGSSYLTAAGQRKKTRQTVSLSRINPKVKCHFKGTVKYVFLEILASGSV